MVYDNKNEFRAITLYYNTFIGTYGIRIQRYNIINIDIIIDSKKKKIEINSNETRKKEDIETARCRFRVLCGRIL